MLADTFSLFFPDNCAGCGEPLLKNEKTICTLCLAELPFTGFHKEKDNLVEKLFWGKVKLEAAISLCYFSKSTRVQHLLHELKYKGNQKVGEFLGKELGKQIKENERFGTIDAVIPVPLHKKKEKKRGYNQSTAIATGVCSVIEKESLPLAVIRNRETSTQTRKSKYARWENVDSIFSVADKKALQGKHVLIIDDVITTGSTLESMIGEILKIEGAKVSVATLACA